MSIEDRIPLTASTNLPGCSENPQQGIDEVHGIILFSGDSLRTVSPYLAIFIDVDRHVSNNDMNAGQDSEIADETSNGSEEI